MRGLPIVRPAAATMERDFHCTRERNHAHSFVSLAMLVLAGKALAYDGENRLTTVMEPAPGASTSTYTYDGSGRRVMKSVDGVSTVYAYDASGTAGSEFRLNPFRRRVLERTHP